jgi:hypothetical protein
MSHVYPLLNSVEILTGAENYNNWKNEMSDILILLQGEGYSWSALQVCTRSVSYTADEKPEYVPATKDVKAHYLPLSTEAQAKNKENAKEKAEATRISRVAIAMINSRISKGLVSVRFDNSAVLWEHLEATYGTAGPSAIFSLYQQTIGFRVTGTKEPSAEIAQLELIYNRLTGCQVDIPELVKAMTLLGSVPEHWKIASAFLAANGDVADVTFQAVRAIILQEYTQRQNQSHAHQANRFSGVKTSGYKPQWQRFKGPQQQQRNNNVPMQQQQPQRQQQQPQQQPRPQGNPKARRSKKKQAPNQVNNANLSTGIISLNNDDDYSSQASTLFANMAIAQNCAPAGLTRPTPARQVERSMIPQKTSDPRPKPYSRSAAAKSLAVQNWNDRMTKRHGETSTIPSETL